MAVVHPFRELLNQISHELTDANLRSLVSLCAQYVAGNRKEKIFCGLDLFDCLIHCNVIGEEKDLMGNLLYLMRKMRPPRKDIIKMVKNFIQEHHEPPWDIDSSGDWFQSVRNSNITDYNTHHQLPPMYEESGHYSSPPFSENNGSLLVSDRTNEQYSWCCICFDCKCTPRPVPVCVLTMCFVIFVALAVFVAVLWFCKVPREWYNNLGEDGQKLVLGAILLVVLTLVAVALLIWIICRKVCQTRARLQCHHQQHQPFNRYSSVEYQDTLSGCSSFTPALSVQAPKKRYKKRRRGSTQSAPVATSTTTSQIFSPESEPTRSRPQPPAGSSLPSYHDGYHDYTDEDGTSGNYASHSDFLTGEESDGPPTVVVSES